MLKAPRRTDNEMKLRDLHRNDVISVYFKTLRREEMEAVAAIPLFSHIRLSEV
jgi:hypothetical protein